MQKKIVLSALVVVLLAGTLFLWPGRPVSFHDMPIQAPAGWVTRIYEDELRIEPRIGLWGIGLVKVSIDACENKSLDELKDMIRRVRIYSEPESRIVDGREWIFASSTSDDPRTFLAYGKITNGRCLRIMGDPEKIVKSVMSQASFVR